MTLQRPVFAFLILAGTAFAEEEKAGMPQMDATWFTNQLFWLAVSFMLLYVIVSRVIKPRVGGVLEERDRAITEAIAEAERARAAAAETRGDFEAAGSSARAQAGELLAQAQAETSREASEAVAKLAHDLARKSDQAEARIADALKKASAQVESAVADLSATMVAKLAGSK
jgi:F-type H+-transporting ATPase subunit b